MQCVCLLAIERWYICDLEALLKALHRWHCLVSSHVVNVSGWSFWGNTNKLHSVVHLKAWSPSPHIPVAKQNGCFRGGGNALAIMLIFLWNICLICKKKYRMVVMLHLIALIKIIAYWNFVCMELRKIWSECQWYIWHLRNYIFLCFFIMK